MFFTAKIVCLFIVLIADFFLKQLYFCLSGQSAKDRAIVDAICELDDDVLAEQRKRPDLEPLIAEALAERLEECESSGSPDPQVQSDKSEHGSAAAYYEQSGDEAEEEARLGPKDQDVTNGKRNQGNKESINNPEEEEKEVLGAS